MLGCVALLAAGCGGKKSPTSDASSTGTVLSDPNSSLNVAGLQYSFFVDENFQGEAAELRIAGASWGRMVDVYAWMGDPGNPTEVLMQEDFVIGTSVGTNLTQYELRRNAVTGEESLLIRRNIDLRTETATQSNEYEEFFELLRQAGDSLTPIFDNTQGAAGFYTMVPRNAAIVLRMDDLLDADTVSGETIQLFTGIPATTPFTARIMADRNHGDLADPNGDGLKNFYTSRIVIDTSISEFESFATDPPLPPNVTGLPASIDVNNANVEIRIATAEDDSIGQEMVLRNVSGHTLTTIDNGSTDLNSTTRDVVRAVRAGGNSAVTGDPFNGFLIDETPPEILGTQIVTIFGNNGLLTRDASDPSLRTFILPQVTFVSEFCAQTPSIGDVFQQAGIYAEVISEPLAHVQGTLVDVRVRLLEYPDEWDEISPNDPTSQWISTGQGQAQFIAPYDPATDEGQEICYVQVTPTPQQFPSVPNAGVLPDSTFTVRFSEPMNPVTISAFDTMTLTRTDEPTVPTDYVVGSIGLSLDLTEFTFEPTLSLQHTILTEERYFLNLGFQAGVSAPSDLSGNPLVAELSDVQLRLNATTASKDTSGRVSRFTSPDEEENLNAGEDDFDDYPEFFGQHTYDVTRQVIRPRPVIRYDAVIDRTHTVTNLWTAWGNDTVQVPVQEPLLRLGSRLQTVWRHVDMGFALGDQTNYNIDVEGIAWAPLGGQVLSDVFREFEISLAHSAHMPDEYWIPPPVDAPGAPNSGLKQQFNANLLDGALDPLQVVHPRFRGYVINPGDKYTSSQSETVLMPFPLNRDIPANEYRYYTWHDTSIPTRGGGESPGGPGIPGIGGAGVDLHQYYIAEGLTIPAFVMDEFTSDGFDAGPYDKFQRASELQTISLPLLMDFKTYPDDHATGLNQFDIGLGGQRDPAPVFRAFSAGGQNSNQEIVLVDPDLETQANGGFNPAGTPPGAETPGLDTKVYLGALNFVVRVSRSYSVWFPVVASDGQSEMPGVLFATPVVEPNADEQPIGTSIELAFRGASSMPSPFGSNVRTDVQEDGKLIDLYGDFYESDINPNNRKNWPPQYPHSHRPDGVNIGIGFLDGTGRWYESIGSINTAQYFQTRITFISNPESGQSPELSAIGWSWLRD